MNVNHVNHVALTAYICKKHAVFEGSYYTTGDLATFLSGSCSLVPSENLRKRISSKVLRNVSLVASGGWLVVGWRLVSNKKKLGDLVGGVKVFFLPVNKFTTIHHLFTTILKVVNEQIKICLL